MPARRRGDPPGSRLSRRAASKSEIERGTGTSPTVGAAAQRAVGPTHQVPVVDEHGQELLDEERVALGRLEDPRAEIARQGGAAGQDVDELRRQSRIERLEVEDGGVRATGPPVGPGLEELRPRRAEDEDRAPLGSSRRSPRAGRAGRLRPVDVLDQDDQRALCRQQREGAADRPGDVLGRGGLGRHTHDARQDAGHPGGIAVGCHQGIDLGAHNARDRRPPRRRPRRAGSRSTASR